MSRYVVRILHFVAKAQALCYEVWISNFVYLRPADTYIVKYESEWNGMTQSSISECRSNPPVCFSTCRIKDKELIKAIFPAKHCCIVSTQ